MSDNTFIFVLTKCLESSEITETLYLFMVKLRFKMGIDVCFTFRVVLELGLVSVRVPIDLS